MTQQIVLPVFKRNPLSHRPIIGSRPTYHEGRSLTLYEFVVEFRCQRWVISNRVIPGAKLLGCGQGPKNRSLTPEGPKVQAKDRGAILGGAARGRWFFTVLATGNGLYWTKSVNLEALTRVFRVDKRVTRVLYSNAVVQWCSGKFVTGKSSEVLFPSSPNTSLVLPFHPLRPLPFSSVFPPFPFHRSRLLKSS